MKHSVLLFLAQHRVLFNLPVRSEFSVFSFQTELFPLQPAFSSDPLLSRKQRDKAITTLALAQYCTTQNRTSYINDSIHA
jgi:hypothetical protein